MGKSSKDCAVKRERGKDKTQNKVSADREDGIKRANILEFENRNDKFL